MKKTVQKKARKKLRTVTAFGIVGLESKALYSNENRTMYAVYSDGFVAESRLNELRGRGLNVELLEVTVSYKA